MPKRKRQSHQKVHKQAVSDEAVGSLSLDELLGGDSVEPVAQSASATVSESDDEYSGEQAQGHAAELEQLREADPEFYAYLAEHGKELLEFDEPEEAEGTAAEEAAAEGDADEDEEVSPSTPTLTLEMWKELRSQALGKLHAKSLRKAMHALRACTMMAETAEAQASGARSSAKFVVQSTRVFRSVVVDMVNHGPKAVRRVLSKGEASGRVKGSQAKSWHHMEGWKKCRPLVVSWFQSVLKLLGSGSDGTMVTFMLRGLRMAIPLLESLPKLTKSTVSSLVTWFASPSSSLEVRMLAYLRLRQVTSTLSHPWPERCMKSMYEAYVNRARKSNDHSRAALVPMGNAVVDILGVEPKAGYRTAFIAVRQLALNLRTATAASSAAAFNRVVGWQFYSTLRLWVAACVALGAEESGVLRPLVYPVTQIILGTLRMAEGDKFIPLRVKLVDLLAHITLHADVHIPTTSFAVDVLGAAAFQRPKFSGTQKAPNMPACIRMSPAESSSKAVLDAVWSEACKATRRGLKAASFTIAFPEQWEMLKPRLTRLRKTLRVPAWRDALQALVVEGNAACQRMTSMRRSASSVQKLSQSLLEEKARARQVEVDTQAVLGELEAGTDTSDSHSDAASEPSDVEDAAEAAHVGRKRKGATGGGRPAQKPKTADQVATLTLDDI
jgi:nucleolar complex protein 2